MKYLLSFLLLVVLSRALYLSAAAEEDEPAHGPRLATDWQQFADRAAFAFDEKKASLRFSMSEYHGDYEVQLAQDEKAKSRFRLEFLRGGRIVLSVPVHQQTVFQVRANKLYVALFWPSLPGCWVYAYDLNDGKVLWRTELQAAGILAHSGYSNAVNISLREGVVVVFGHEVMGDYLEILDERSGARLAHKVFPRAVTKVAPPEPFPEDRRLDVKVTYHYPEKIPFAQLFKDLSRQTGVRVSVAPDFPAARITAAEHTESLRAAMRRWTVGRSKWIRDGDGYRLILPPKVEKK